MLLDLRASSLSAPSGMRRLMLYQLQEDYLKSLETRKNEQKQGQETPRRAGESASSKPVAAVAPRTRRTPSERSTAPAVTERPVILRPAPQEPTVYELVFAHYNYQIIASALIYDLDAERQKRRQRARRRAAAVLLLAA